MASTWNKLERMLGVVFPASMVVLAVVGGTAMAQETCPDETLNGSLLAIADPSFPGYMPHAQAQACALKYGGCFRFDGSDTLTDVMEQTIAASGTCLSYHNVGSSQGETNLQYTAGDAGVTGTAAQCIAPMSRNFTAPVLSAHPTWAPVQPDNIKALDAVVWNFQNRAGAAVDMEDYPPGVCVNECPLLQNQTITAAAVILGGYPQGSNTTANGETAECADPCRVCLLEWLGSAAMEGTGIMQHIYRPDDKSGTQDFIRQVYGFDRWCNGKSVENRPCWAPIC